MRKYLLTAALVAATLPLMAREFDAVTPSGHTIYCDMTAGGVKIVGWDRPQNSCEPVHVVIPSYVSNGGADLRVVAIGDSAFIFSPMITSIELPSSIRSIGRNAFDHDYGIGSIVIPSSVDTIGPDAFSLIPNVEYSGTSQGSPWGAYYWNTYHEGPFYYSDEQKRHIVCCKRDATVTAIPSSVTSIGDYAFAYCYNLTSVSIDSTVEDVGDFAFIYCCNLAEVYYNPRHSGIYIFQNCISLERLTFGDVITKIPMCFCKDCSSLKNLIVPDNIVSAPESAFMNCTSLETVEIGKGMTELGYSMFEGCTALQKVIATDSLKSVTLFTFLGCSSLREVDLGYNLSLIGGWAFQNCSSLESIHLGRHMRLIANDAFSNCTSLSEIVLLSEVRSLGRHAFSGCSSISKIICMAETCPTMGAGVFDSIDSGIEVIVPCNRINDYSRDTSWQRFENIQGQQYYMEVSTNNRQWGYAVATQQPTCDNNAAVIEAIPAEGCRFVRWSDGNAENPRQIIYNGTGYAYRRAFFEPVVSICETEPSREVRVFPVREGIVIEGAQDQQAEVYDIMGRKMLDCKVTDTRFLIPATSLPSHGIFIVKVAAHPAVKVIL